MAMQCDKIRFRTKPEAKEAMDAFVRKITYGPRPKFVYFCQDCQAWHFTKKKGNKAERAGLYAKLQFI